MNIEERKQYINEVAHCVGLTPKEVEEKAMYISQTTTMRFDEAVYEIKMNLLSKESGYFDIINYNSREGLAILETCILQPTALNAEKLKRKRSTII